MPITALLASLLASMPVAAPLATPLAEPPAGDLLAGPKVDLDAVPAARRPSIVRRDFEGRIERAGPEPGRAALEAMRDAGGAWALDDAERAALETVTIERAVAFSAELERHKADILRLEGIGARARGASVAGRLAALAELIGIARKFEPYFARGGFLDEFARAPGVRAETIAKAREIERRYIEALVREARLDDPKALEALLRVRIGWEHRGELLKEAIESYLAAGTARFEDFAERIGLDGAEAEGVKAAFMEVAIAEIAGNATARQRFDAVSEAYKAMRPESRRRFLAYLAEERAAARTASTSERPPARSGPDADGERIDADGMGRGAEAIDDTP
ncbi:MAG: hypothetical protein RI967_1602 [Planctomycetota bacterium]